MMRAWEIARNGQKQFGGSVRSYISEAMKLAWKQAKQGQKMEHTIIIKTDVYNEKRWSKPWGALISVQENGKVDYKFNGQFVGEAGFAGQVIMKAQTGQIIAFGQKDNRNGNSINTWYKIVGNQEKIVAEEGRVIESSSLEQISQTDAVSYLLGF